MRVVLIIILSLITLESSPAQNLLGQRIRKINSTKTNNYFQEGIFHGGAKVSSGLMKVRHSFDKKDKIERIVFDFDTQEVPAIYTYFNSKNQKLSMDVSKLKVNTEIGSFGTSEFVTTLNVFPFENDIASMELIFKKNVEVEIFALSKPGRLVIDVKGIQ
jgi:hypothetical protein